MSSEANLPELPSSSAPPPAAPSEMQMGGDNTQTNGAAANGKSRRRRRKRKKPNAGGEGQAQAQPQGGSTDAPASAAESNSQPQQQQGGQGKRWKKKKGRNDGQQARSPRPEPGNSLHGSNNGRRNRNTKPRGPRTFVGPMDHSYREVNGNYSDTPRSTIEIHGNVRRSSEHHHRSQFREDRLPPELTTNARAVAIPENAPTHIYFFVDDLFLTAKINESSRQQGVKVAFMKPDKDVVAHLADLDEHDHPSLIVIDLDKAANKPLTLIPKLKAKLKKRTSIIGFLNHLQAGELKLKAMEAGCHTVMAKAAFSQNLPNLLRRYGMDEEDEPNYNQ